MGSMVVLASMFELALEPFCIHRATKVKSYVADFNLVLEHFYIHMDGRGVLDELEHCLDL